jgi:uncharacterized protein
MSKFKLKTAYEPDKEYELLPLTFTPLNSDEYVVTNFAGESLVMTRAVVRALAEHNLDTNSADFASARSAHLVRFSGEKSPTELLALKYRSKKQKLREFTSLHILVVSLRCDHSCPYCQVSRRSEDKARFDMSPEIVEKAIELIFRSPSKAIKVEFQGGEPLLNFELIKKVVLECEIKATNDSRDLEFVIATTLSLLTNDVLDFCEQHNILLSTSLDGPEELHNKNRPRPGRDSYERYVSGLAKARDKLGRDRVSALMTTTQASLSQVKPIIDEYLALGFDSIFLRPLSPYGFAMKTKQYDAYRVNEWLDFYREGLDYIIDLNLSGVFFREIYTTIILQKMLTFDDPGYVDLMNPAGIGIAAVVYNYDGSVYASDESRMLAEMGIEKFRLGSVLTDSYEDIFGSDALLEAIEDSFTLSSPMCCECAFEPYCGADPVFHFGVYGDILGRKAESSFCTRNMEIFKNIFELRKRPEIAEIFESWVYN